MIVIMMSVVVDFEAGAAVPKIHRGPCIWIALGQK